MSEKEGPAMATLPFSLPALLCGEKPSTPPLYSAPWRLFAQPQGQTQQQLVDAYAKAIGPGWAMTDCGMDMGQQRAALLACRRNGFCPPLVACLALDEEGMTPDGWRADAALVLLQSMGCAALVVTPADEEAAHALPRLFSLLWQDARIPLGVALPQGQNALEPTQFPYANLFWVADEAQGQGLAQWVAQRKPAPIAPPPEDDGFIAVANGHSFLLDATFDLDGQLECGPDFSGQLLELEGEGCTALRLLLPDEHSLAIFCAEQYMVTLPLCIATEDPDLLEQALAAFQGRGIYDGTCPVEDETLQRLVEEYGLIVL